tara:strand:- start:14295 stop:16052 length:1758 start_codon:yes stop_codon:yes gene_type:complete
LKESISPAKKNMKVLKMNRKLKQIFTNYRVIILLACLILATVSIHPNPSVKGVTIRNVLTNSSASLAGIQGPAPTTRPMSRERVLAVNNVDIDDIEDYYNIIEGLRINQTVHIKTNKGLYKLITRAEIEEIELNETIERLVVEEVFNETSNQTQNITNIIREPKKETYVKGVEDIGLKVYKPPKTNVKLGLDLQGGVRVLLQPEEKVSKIYTDDLIASLNQRLNVYGLSDVVIRSSSDLSGNQYILVEIAGANEEEVKELIAKQGKFESKIGNETVFRGGEDITYVCRSADCAGIDPNQGCGIVEGGGYACRFRFSISLSPEAAERQAELTKDLEVVTDAGGEYLTEKLYLFLDDKEVDQLSIGADLKGRAVTDIQISGSGFGATNQEAVFNSLQNMKKLQTILITGSLPVKLNIVKTDNVSPILGEEFVKNAMLMGLFVLIGVAVVVSIRYRKLQITVPMVISLASELVLLIGVASIIGWNIDLPAIAGIIIAIGTGVDHLIVISDETIGGKSIEIFDWKKRIKKAFFIITAAYLTTVVAMVPLIFAGAGLLKGFAITTIIGVSIGIFIARPAFANVVEILLRE